MPDIEGTENRPGRVWAPPRFSRLWLNSLLMHNTPNSTVCWPLEYAITVPPILQHSFFYFSFFFFIYIYSYKRLLLLSLLYSTQSTNRGQKYRQRQDWSLESDLRNEIIFINFIIIILESWSSEILKFVSLVSFFLFFSFQWKPIECFLIEISFLRFCFF